MTRRLTAFASFHGDPDLPAYIRYHLAALRPFSDCLVFVSNSPVSASGKDFLASIGCEFLQRENTGFDFAAWRDGLDKFPTEDFDEILLTNSSIIGPVRDLSSVFAQMKPFDGDFWGLTTSFGGGRKHLQSFFLVFRKPLITSRAWADWWRNIEDLHDKNEVIRRYEIPLYRYFEKAGFSGSSFISPPRKREMTRPFLRKREGTLPVVPAMRYWTNVTIHSPVELVQQGFPYVKASLIWGHNRRQGIDLARLQQMPDLSYDWDIIQP
ncbi:rhamnan synthesis F family protein [Croceicoccus marinus]|uniref:Rhamnan synthesis protein F n=1 Tax=Croceicoccus marinus TaxID=450378 RepID=A0A1Z1FCA2_9SPHN|nr:rhamnan synthesis F family protein [Croceicoccus marinus]ARU16390.1 hypothetical protein A9D14_09555 [Croceicoccus marinus]